MVLPMLLSLATSASWAQASVADFELGGNAKVLDEECIRLTPDTPYATGSAWFGQPIDLAHGFEMKVQIVLGRKDAEGADGIVFVFHPGMQTGWRGEGMGFAGLYPSLGIEFDTYRNVHLGDPEADHIAVMQHGESFHGMRLPPIEVGDLEDGQRHPLRITWDPTGGLAVWLDGVKRGEWPPELVVATFGGTPQVHWGMTAGTGRLANAQDVCIEQLRRLGHHRAGAPAQEST